MKKSNSHIENKRRAAPTAVRMRHKRPKEGPRQAAKRTEEALRESEQRYRELVEDMNEVIYEIDASGRITYISPVVEEISGYSPEEIIGRPFVEFVPPDEVPARMGAFEEGLSGRPIPSEFSLVSKSGKIRWVHTFGRVIREGDRIAGFRGVLTDITERRRAEETLRDGRTRLELLAGISAGVASGISVEQIIEHTVESISAHFPMLRVAYSTIDEEDKLTVIYSVEPEGMANLTGLRADLTAAPEYARSLRTREPVVVEDVTQDGRMPSLAGAMTAGGTRAVLDVPMHHRGGLVGLLCFDSPDPRRWSDHDIATLTEIADYLSVALDRKRVDDALRESEERFRTLSDAAFEGIVITVDGRILEANGQLARMLGAEVVELVGRRVLDFVAPESHDAVLEAIRLQLEETYEALAVRKDGSTIPVEVRGKAIAYRGGSARVTVLRDLSARKRADDALRDSEERYRDLYDGAPVAYFAIGKDGRIAKANRRASELLGYSLDDLIGRSVLALYSDTPAGKDKAKRVIERFRRGRETHDEEMEMRRADGSPVWVSLTVRIVRDAGGQPVETRSMVLDITERKRAEEALRMAQEELESGAEIQAQGVDSYGFSLRELTVLNLVASGKTDKEIGTTLGISARTVQKHVEKLCKRMGASTRTEASVRALREGLIE